MRTQIRYKDGKVETYDDAAPSVDIQNKELTIVGEKMEVLSKEPIALHAIAKLVFIP